MLLPVPIRQSVGRHSRDWPTPVNNSGAVNVTVTAHYTTSSGTVDVTSAATTLRIANVNPTATFAVTPISVNIGAPAPTVSFTNQFSYLGGATPFTYAYDLLNTGNYTVSTSSSMTVPTSLLQLPGTYTINGKIIDSNTPGNFTAYSTTLKVNYVSPTLTLSGVPNPVQNGNNFTLTATATSPGKVPINTWIVDWGDGTLQNPDIQTFNQQTASGTAAQFDHIYTSTQGSPYTIKVTAVDSYGQTNATLQPAVVVTPGDPEISITSVLPSPGTEGTQEDLAGLLISTSTTNTYAVTVNWGDSTSSVINLGAGTSQPFQSSHLYLPGSYTITASVLASDGGTATSLPASITVNNVAPTVSVSATSPIVEAGTTTLVGTVTDPGLTDTQNVVINWGDGTQTTGITLGPNGSTVHALVDASGKPFTHQYIKEPANDTFTITVTSTDDDGGTGVGTVPVTVQNVSPQVGNLKITSNSGFIIPNSPATLTGVVADPGINDQQTVTIVWGDGSANTVFNLTPPGNPSQPAPFTQQHTYTQAGAFTITVTSVDSDGASGSASITAATTGVFLLPDGTLSIGGTPSSDTVTVRQPAIPIGYWNLNDPRGSTVVLDSSPTGNNGTFFAGPQGFLGAGGIPASLAPYGALTAASFSSSPANYISIPDNAAYHVANGSDEFRAGKSRTRLRPGSQRRRRPGPLCSAGYDLAGHDAPRGRVRSYNNRRRRNARSRRFRLRIDHVPQLHGNVGSEQPFTVRRNDFRLCR